jgi:hypothetical protein
MMQIPRPEDGTMERELTSIAVEIPAGTEPAFKKLVAAWVEGTMLSPEGTEARRPTPLHEDELLQRAVDWWRSLTSREREIFGLWVDAAPNLVAADEIARTLGLKSTKSIRGHIRRLAEKAGNVGFQAGWQSGQRDPLSGQVLYGLRDFGTGAYAYDRLTLTATEYAALLDRARALVNDK